MLAALAENWRYERALERLARRAFRRGRPTPLWVDGPDLRDLSHQLGGVATQLARQVSAGRYRFSPVEPRHIVTDKPRVVYAMTGADHAVLLVLASLLSEAIEPTLPDGLHSYRCGRSSLTALQALSGYLRAHRAKFPVRARGLYVLRRDVRSYGDSIPAGDGSCLWQQLEDALAPGPEGLLDFVRAGFRPPVRWPDGHVAPREVGIVNGNPCQTVACNLYCQPIDRALSGLEGSLYLRYGDDLLFAHPDPDVAREAARLLDATALQLGLEWGAEKSRALYVTAPGRRPPGNAAEFAPAARIEYLGLSTGFEGARSLRPARSRGLLRRLRKRLHHALGTPQAPTDRQARAELAVQVVAVALDPAAPVCDPLAEVLAGPLDDRAQLRHLDHEIALLVAQRACRQRGVRAFRSFPPRTLHALGLPSLVARRNRRAAHAG